MQAVRQALRGLQVGSDEMSGKLAIRILKMTSNNDPELFLNSFEQSALAAGWPEDQWVSILILCLVESAQQVIETLALEELTDSGEV